MGRISSNKMQTQNYSHLFLDPIYPSDRWRGKRQEKSNSDQLQKVTIDSTSKNFWIKLSGFGTDINLKLNFCGSWHLLHPETSSHFLLEKYRIRQQNIHPFGLITQLFQKSECGKWLFEMESVIWCGCETRILTNYLWFLGYLNKPLTKQNMFAQENLINFSNYLSFGRCRTIIRFCLE